MAYTITGKILLIGSVESFPYQDKVFRKMELVLDASRFNPMTGEQYKNYPKLEVIGKHVDELSSFQVGQLVTVSFAISGRRIEKDGEVSYFTNLQAFKFEPYQRHVQTQGYHQAAQGPQAPNYPQPAARTAHNTPIVEQPQSMTGQGEVSSKQEGDDLPF